METEKEEDIVIGQASQMKDETEGLFDSFEERFLFLTAYQLKCLKDKFKKMGVRELQDLKFLEVKDLMGAETGISTIQVRKIYGILVSMAEPTYSTSSSYTSTPSNSTPPNSPASVASFSSVSVESSESDHISHSVSPDSDWAQKFEIPWNKLPPNFIKDCKESKCPKPSKRKQVIRILVDEMQLQCRKPSTKDIFLICLKIVEKFKCLSDNLNGTLIGSGISSWQNQITERIHNKNRVSGKRVTDNTTLGKPNDTRKRVYGCLESWKEVPVCTSESDELKAKQEWLKEESRKISSNQNHQLVKENMTDTFPLQRLLLNTDPPVLEVKKEWPYLFSRNGCFDHFSKLTGVGIEQEYLISSKYRKKVLLEFMKTQKDEQIKEVFEEMSKYSGTTNTDGIIMLLLKYFKEDGLIELYPIATDTKKIEDKYRKNGYPVIRVIGNLFTSTIFHVVIENKSVAILDLFDDSVMVMFALHYILNLEYLKNCTATLEFIQRAYMGINPVKGSKNKKKGKVYPVNPRVLQLVNALKIFESNM